MRAIGRLLRASRSGQPALLAAALGDLEMAKGDAEGAIGTYAKILASKHDSIPAMVGMAQAKLSQDKNAEAESLLKSALISDPESAAANAELGLLQVKQNEYEAAFPHLQKAWADDHSNRKVALAIARVYERQDRPGDALKVLAPIEGSANDSVEFQLELAKLHRMLGQTDAERAALDKLKALQSDTQASLRFDNPSVYVF